MRMRCTYHSGYNLGQHNLPSCKLNVYDHSIRIPMMIRGPGIPHGLNFTQIGSNVDVAPTFLSLAGLDPTKISNGPPMDGKSLLPWLIQSSDATSVQLPEMTRAQLRTERARLGLADSVRSAVTPVRDHHWVEFYSLGSFGCCGGGTCKADQPDHTGSGSLDGMRCGAGRSSPGDPTHMVDSAESNTYRALRFVSATHGNKLYAEFTRVTDWNFTARDIFVEVFDLDSDPGQLRNIVNETAAEDMEFYRATTKAQFMCAGASCT